MTTRAVLRIASFVVFFSLFMGRARAEDAPTPAKRPVQYGSIEVNPLAALAGPLGGQLQVGVAGPMTIQVAGSYLSLPYTAGCSSDGCSGGPAARGLLMEIGPRFFVPIGKGGNFLYVGPAWGHDWFHQDGVQIAARSEADGFVVPAGAYRRDRLIVDAGAHLPLGRSPVYVLPGAGVSYMLTKNNPLHEQSGNLAAAFGNAVSPHHYLREQLSPRFLLAFGAGF